MTPAYTYPHSAYYGEAECVYPYAIWVKAAVQLFGKGFNTQEISFRLKRNEADIYSALHHYRTRRLAA